jgi:hypothetical protein
MTVWECFQAHQGRQIDKWRHYFDIYEKHFARFVGKSPRVLEIGVDHGGSLQLWKDYFGLGADIIGVDIDERCFDYAESGITIWIGDQKDLKIASFGPFDIVIDDGSHMPRDQITSFKNLWPSCTGVYLIEDIHVNPSVIYATTSEAENSIGFYYPWVVVVERPQRIIKGTPSRPLREDEKAAREAQSVRLSEL